MINWIIDLWVCAWRPLLALLVIAVACIMLSPDEEKDVIRLHGPQKPTMGLKAEAK